MISAGGRGDGSLQGGAASQPSEWRLGWPLVAAGGVGMALSSLHAGALGVLMHPLQEAFGWSRAAISASILIICVCILTLGPFIGPLIDRFGARRVALTGIVGFCATLAGVGLTGPGVASWYLAWALVGLVYPTVSTVMWTFGIGRCFDRERGLALAVALSGVGVAGLISPLITVALLPAVGWRGVFFALALGGFLIAFPTAWVAFHPERIVRQVRATPGGAPQPLTGWSIRQIVSSVRFWSMAVVMLLLAAAVGALMLHFQPILRDAGLSAAEAAGYAALIGPATVVGRVIGGWFLDRFPARIVAAVFFLSPAAVCAILLNYDASPTLSLTAAIGLGLAAGAEGDAVAYLTAKYFGLKRYTFSYAILIGLFSFAYGLAPVIAGAVFDAFGAYDPMLTLLIAGLFVSALITLLLGRPPEFDPTGR
jgi:MFS family permease